jgi:hypothetical protein
MITMRQIEELQTVSVDFDKYVPLTATWSSASRVLDPPRYLALRDGNGYLEFKFHPSTGIMIEVVIATSTDIKVEQANLSPPNSGG